MGTESQRASSLRAKQKKNRPLSPDEKAFLRQYEKTKRPAGRPKGSKTRAQSPDPAPDPVESPDTDSAPDPADKQAHSVGANPQNADEPLRPLKFAESGKEKAESEPASGPSKELLDFVDNVGEMYKQFIMKLSGANSEITGGTIPAIPEGLADYLFVPMAKSWLVDVLPENPDPEAMKKWRPWIAAAPVAYSVGVRGYIIYQIRKKQAEDKRRAANVPRAVATPAKPAESAKPPSETAAPEPEFKEYVGV